MVVDTKKVADRRPLRYFVRYAVLTMMWIAVGSSAAAQISSPDDVAVKEQAVPKDGPLPLNMNLVMPTMGGAQIWTDEWVRGDYRIQRNVLTGHYRLLDDQDMRLAWGTIDQCQTRFEQVVVERKLPPVTGKVVILLHGLGRSKAVVKPLGDYLREKGGYTSICMNYASTREGVEQHAQALERVIDHLKDAEELNFVCHSLGNIVLRHYLADEARRPPTKRPPLKRIVMLGPPNNGALIARRLQGTGVFGLIAGRSGEALGRGWDNLVGHLATPACEFGIIAGGKGDEKGNNPLLPGDDDLVVTVEETRLAGATDFMIVPKRHTSLLKDESVREATLRFLRQGCFQADGKREPIHE